IKEAILAIIQVLNNCLLENKRQQKASRDFTSPAYQNRKIPLSARCNPEIKVYVYAHPNIGFGRGRLFDKGELVTLILKLLQKEGCVIDFTRGERENQPYWEVQL